MRLQKEQTTEKHAHPVHFQSTLSSRECTGTSSTSSGLLSQNTQLFDHFLHKSVSMDITMDTSMHNCKFIGHLLEYQWVFKAIQLNHK